MANHNHGSPSPTYHRIGTSNIPTETKLFIVIDSRAPMIVRVPKPPGQVTLKEFKKFTSLNGDCYKFYFQSHDPEFGIVKEEIVDDDAILPDEYGRVVAWVLSDNSQTGALLQPVLPVRSTQEVENYYCSNVPLNNHDRASVRNHGNFLSNSQPSSPVYSLNGQFNFTSGKRSTPPDSPENMIVSFQLCEGQSLGVGHVYPGEDCLTNGIIVDHVQRNSVAERDGRIISGDRIIEVNGIDLRYLSLGEALKVFRRIIEQGGSINLLIQRSNGILNGPPLPPIKTPNNRPRVPPRPPNRLSESPAITTPTRAKLGFDPATELPDPIIESDQMPNGDIQTNRVTDPKPITNFNRRLGHHERQAASQSLPRSLTPRSWFTTANIDSLNSSANLGPFQMESRSDYEPTTSSLRSDLYQIPLHCGRDNIQTIYSALKADSSNLEIKDREWLKVVVRDAFLGSTLIKWLSRNVFGFCNRSEVKRFANQMLVLGLIRSPISKATFSEKCFYTLS